MGIVGRDCPGHKVDAKGRQIQQFSLVLAGRAAGRSDHQVDVAAGGQNLLVSLGQYVEGQVHHPEETATVLPGRWRMGAASWATAIKGCTSPQEPMVGMSMRIAAFRPAHCETTGRPLLSGELFYTG